MIVVRLMGGLGNQMFQYALGRRLAIFHRTELKLDLSFLLDRTPRRNFVYRNYDLDIFNISTGFASTQDLKRFGVGLSTHRVLQFVLESFWGKLKAYKVMRERSFYFDRNVLKCPFNTYLVGYWASEKYFKDIESTIRNDFTFRHDFDNHCRDLADEISQTNSVCLNVRRGDFVSHPLHDVCGMDYFHRAARDLSEKVEDAIFYVFSDDIEWCQKHIHLNYPTNYVTHDYSGNRFGHYLHLMSLCKHYIIPNSTFGWWGAWLSKNREKKVIGPSKWLNREDSDTRDLLPESWIRL